MNSQSTQNSAKAENFMPVGRGAADQRAGDDREGHLIGAEQHFRDGLGEGLTVSRPMPRRKIGREVADQRAVAAKGEAIADDEPEQRDDGRGREALRHGRENIFLAHHAGIEQRQPRQGHQQHQSGGENHESRCRRDRSWLRRRRRERRKGRSDGRKAERGGRNLMEAGPEGE